MNQTFKTRSALIRAAESAQRREQLRQSAQIFGVASFIVAAILIAALIQQVLP
jgi:hypothetical protein